MHMLLMIDNQHLGPEASNMVRYPHGNPDYVGEKVSNNNRHRPLPSG